MNRPRVAGNLYTILPTSFNQCSDDYSDVQMTGLIKISLMSKEPFGGWLTIFGHIRAHQQLIYQLYDCVSKSC